MYMDDIKLFVKNEKVSETLIQAVSIYSQDIGMELGIEKWAMPITKNRKLQMTEEIELSTQEKIRTLGEKETYKYLGILEEDTVKLAKMKEKLKKPCFRRTRKLLETKLHKRNLIKGINTWAFPPRNILSIILKEDDKRTSTNGPDYKKLHTDPEMTLINCMCQEKKGKEDLPALKIA